MASNIELITQDLESRLRQLTDVRLDSLKRAKDLRVARHAFLQRERIYLSARLGTDHPRVKQVATRLDSNQRIINALEVQHEIGRAVTPAVLDTDVLIQGRLTDENRRGIAGVKVSLVDTRNRRIAEAGTTETDDAGNYALTVSGDVAKEINARHKKGVFVSFVDNKDKVVRRADEALPLEPGARLSREVKISRREIQPGILGIKPRPRPTRPTQPVGPRPAVKKAQRRNKQKTKKKAAGKTPLRRSRSSVEVGASRGEVKGRSPARKYPRLETITGIGPRRAAILKNANVKDIPTFVKTDNGTLTELLGELDFNAMKKKARALLK
jgi:hypothetical protein